MKYFSLTTAREAVGYVTSVADGVRRVLLVASPGSGATLLARRFTAQLGLLDGAELHEAAWIRYGARLYRDVEDCWSTQRPFRAPHHTCSAAAIFGGGPPGAARPGEIALAHAGVLFLDEVDQFRRHVVDSLLYGCRDARPELRNVPCEPRLLIGSVTPCPCGHRGNPKRACVCSAPRVERWQHRVDSLAAHFDHVVTLRVPLADMQAVGEQLPVRSSFLPA